MEMVKPTPHEVAVVERYRRLMWHISQTAKTLDKHWSNAALACGYAEGWLSVLADRGEVRMHFKPRLPS